MSEGTFIRVRRRITELAELKEAVLGFKRLTGEFPETWLVGGHATFRSGVRVKTDRPRRVVMRYPDGWPSIAGEEDAEPSPFTIGDYKSGLNRWAEFEFRGGSQSVTYAGSGFAEPGA